MSFTFNPTSGLVIVQTEVEGPKGSVITRLALDTGASSTLINVAMLVAVGYDPGLAPTHVRVVTGSGIELVPQVAVSRLRALGQDRQQLKVLAHTLPPSASIDGVLGLDFLRGQVLSIDFRLGQISLT